MSVSLYYTAKRDYPLSEQERETCLKIAERYIAEYSLGDMYESFCVYDLSQPSEENVVFEGATKLPLNEGEDHFAKVFYYWSDCLQEVIDLLSHAQWDIHINDTDITSHFDYSE